MEDGQRDLKSARAASGTVDFCTGVKSTSSLDTDSNEQVSSEHFEEACPEKLQMERLYDALVGYEQ